jgi:hypothetical protein
MIKLRNIFICISIILLINSLNIITNNICCFTYNTMANAMVLQNSSDDSAYYIQTNNCINSKIMSNRTCSSFINYNLHKNNLIEFKKELEVIKIYKCDVNGICKKAYPYNKTNPDNFKVYFIFYKNMEFINWYVNIINLICYFL